MNAFEAAQKQGRAEELQQELEALFVAQNRSPSADTTIIRATYLQVTVAVPSRPHDPSVSPLAAQAVR